VKNAWGGLLNTDMALIESAILGTVSIAIGGLTVYSLTTANGAADQAREYIQQYTGALTGTCVVTLPSVPKVGWAQNSTTGGHNITLTTVAGASVTIPPDGTYYWYMVDGSANVSFPSFSYSALMAQSLTVSGNATIGGTLGVTGATTLGGTLSVVGDITASGAGTGLAVTNNATVGGTFGVSGTLTAGGAGTGLVVSHNATIAGTFGVAGLASFTGVGTGLAVTNDMTVGGKVSPTAGWLVGSTSNPIANTTNGSQIVSDGSQQIYNTGARTPFTIGVGAAIGMVNFYYTTTPVGSISTNGGSVAYNQTSDATLKIGDGLIQAEQSGRIIDRLHALWFRWKSDPDADPMPGFFAQQVARVFPWAVTRGRGKKGRPNYQPWQMDAGKLMPVVIAELQFLRKRVAELERRSAGT
jgi:hypothetical protein